MYHKFYLYGLDLFAAGATWNFRKCHSCCGQISGNNMTMWINTVDLPCVHHVLAAKVCPSERAQIPHVSQLAVSKKRYSTTIHIHWFKMSFSPTPKKYSQIFGRCANTILCLTICLSWSLGDKFFRMAKTRLEVNIPSYNAPKVFGRENKNILRTWQGSVYDCSSAAFLQSPSSHSKRRMDWSAIFLW